MKSQPWGSISVLSSSRNTQNLEFEIILSLSSCWHSYGENGNPRDFRRSLTVESSFRQYTTGISHHHSFVICPDYPIVQLAADSQQAKSPQPTASFCWYILMESCVTQGHWEWGDIEKWRNSTTNDRPFLMRKKDGHTCWTLRWKIFPLASTTAGGKRGLNSDPFRAFVRLSLHVSLVLRFRAGEGETRAQKDNRYE